MAGQGEFGAELAAKTDFRADGQASVHDCAQTVGQGQTKPGATILAGDAGLCLSEGAENSGLGLLGDADAGIANLDTYLIALRAEPYIHPPESGEFQRVGQQIADDLSDPGRVPHDQCRKLRIDQAGQFHAGCGVL